MVPAMAEFLLAGAWGKLVRSEYHLEALKSELRTFLDSKPYGVTAHLDYERSRYVYYIHRVDEPVPAIPHIIGDFIHNLRSSLDHLAWQLSIQRYGGIPPEAVWREIAYPIARSRKDFKSLQSLKHFKTEHVAFMKGFQPEHRTPNHPLVVLNELCNTDKHRTVHTALITAGDISPVFIPNDHAEILDSWYAKGQKLVVGTKCACVLFERHGPDPKVTMDSLPVNIGFGDCPDVAIGALRDIARDILNGATEEFFGT